MKALEANALASVREIQALQAPHIADPDDTAMARLEQRMTGSEAAARRALAALAPLVQPASRSRLAAATQALDRFMALNAQIISLSRRNTNVRSLALSRTRSDHLSLPVRKACAHYRTRWRSMDIQPADRLDRARRTVYAPIAPPLITP